MSEVLEFQESEAVQTPVTGGDLSDVVDIGFLIQILEFAKENYLANANIVEEQAVQLCQEFKNLAARTVEQTASIEEAVHLARNIELEGEVIPYEKSVEILYEPLAEAIGNILQVSKLAMSMVMMIGNAADNITRVEACIDQVQKLTRQTNMLAMNTQIEAARAGEAGRSFRIIAQEVKSLSESIKKVSEEIQSEAEQVSRSVRESSKLVDSLANYDMTDNLQLRGRIDGLVNSIVEQNVRFTQLLEDAAQTAQNTANSINMLVVTIQFQDRNSQYTTNLAQMIDYVIEQLRHLQAKYTGRPANEADVQSLISGVTLSELRDKTIGHFQEKEVLSTESELYQRYLAPKETSASSSSGTDGLFDDDDDDDISLF